MLANIHTKKEHEEKRFAREGIMYDASGLCWIMSGYIGDAQNRTRASPAS